MLKKYKVFFDRILNLRYNAKSESCVGKLVS